MIYGLVPVGGKGTRLALPYPKELLPQKGYDHFNPVINHIVQKMKDAGAHKIVFVHGSEVKSGIVEYYPTHEYVHLTQNRLGFATVIEDMYNAIPHFDFNDKVLFGMPDTIFEGNPFVEMVRRAGIVCGLFQSDPLTKVDRLLKSDNQHFQVKTAKTELNQDWFWGVIKFDGTDIEQIIDDNLLANTSEVGVVLNHYLKSYVYGGSYLDLGTWSNYNRYLALYGDENDQSLS